MADNGLAGEIDAAFVATLADDLTVHDSFVPTGGKISCVDVGSCYNPFGGDPSGVCFEPKLDVIALDLCPSAACRSSVYFCDFLDLTVSGESPIVDEADHDDDNDQFGPRRYLRSLPVNMYHAVTVSLVLSYIPTPQQRYALILKAHQLLLLPNEPTGGMASVPHLGGVLVIVEKDSVLHRQKYYPLFLAHWKSVIAGVGFELVKYERITASRGRKAAHAFIWKAVSGNDANASRKTPETHGLYTRQDFSDERDVDRFFGLN